MSSSIHSSGFRPWAVSLLLALASVLVSVPAEEQEKSPAGGGQEPIRIGNELVLLAVTVTDTSGRPVDGMQKDDFIIFENKISQDIAFFSSDQVPVSWGLVLDRSGSMKSVIKAVYRAAVLVIESGTQEDEAFIMTFNDRVDLVQDFTSSERALMRAITWLEAKGRTALYDAVHEGLQHIQSGKHPKKVLLVVTDGEDNRSRVSFGQLRHLVREGSVLVYTIGFYHHTEHFSWTLPRLAEETGGRGYFPRGFNQLQAALWSIAAEVSHQYSLGYYPQNSARDGKWRKIKVKLRKKKGRPRYMIRTRAGYYAAKG